MAVLSNAERTQCHEEVQVCISKFRRSTDLTKAQWRTLVDDIDQWVHDTGQASANSAISLPVRTIASTREKVLALFVVLEKRYNLNII